jgi:hypothetical protein
MPPMACKHYSSRQRRTMQSLNASRDSEPIQSANQPVSIVPLVVV